MQPIGGGVILEVKTSIRNYANNIQVDLNIVKIFSNQVHWNDGVLEKCDAKYVSLCPKMAIPFSYPWHFLPGSSVGSDLSVRNSDENDNFMSFCTVFAKAYEVARFCDELGGRMLTVSEIKSCKQVGATARSELETQLDEVIKSLEEAAREIEELIWETEGSAPAN
jgi:hypothetical protein